MGLALEVVEVFDLFIEVLLVGQGLNLVLDVANRDLKLHFADLHEYYQFWKGGYLQTCYSFERSCCSGRTEPLPRRRASSGLTLRPGC